MFFELRDFLLPGTDLLLKPASQILLEIAGGENCHEDVRSAGTVKKEILIFL